MPASPFEPAPSEAGPFGLPPEEAIRWFREKGYSLNFDWRDMWGAQHASAFSVAKVTQLDLLSDIREELDRAIAKGETLQSFSKRLTPTLKDKGWWGKKEVEELDADGKPTGRMRTVQLGSANRLRVIYETNLRQAMAAGRWERIERTAERRPYLRYVAMQDGNTRDEHLRWHNTVLRWDDPWWQTHAPPNGWGCRCKIQQLSERDLARYGLGISKEAPPVQHKIVINPRTNQKVRVTEGIDPSFDYNPGLAPRGSSTMHLTPLRNQKDWRATRWNGETLPSAKTWPDRTAPSDYPILRTDEDVEEVRERFRKEFGVRRGQTATLTDPTGLQLFISEERLIDHATRKVLADENDRSKGLKFRDPSRAKYVSRVRDTVEHPEEVWMQPHRQEDGRVVMRTVYLARYSSTDDDEGMVVVAHRDPDGWVTWTLYPRKELDNKREGYLVYKK